MGDLTGPELVSATHRLFPRLAISPLGFYDRQVFSPEKGVDGMFVGTLDKQRVAGEPIVPMGNVLNAAGEYVVDYAHPAHITRGVRVEDSSDGSWTPCMEQCLQEFLAERAQCGFMEWHTDQGPYAVRPAYAAIFCKTGGGSRTAFAHTAAGLQQLPAELREQVQDAVVEYKTGQDVPPVRMKFVQRHVHTGEEHLNFTLGAKVLGLSRDDSYRLTWQVMRHITRDDNRYFHVWEPGDLVLWDQRSVVHSRMHYELRPEDPREVWRLSFYPDELEWIANADHPQLNLNRTCPDVGEHTAAVRRYLVLSKQNTGTPTELTAKL